MGCPVHQSALEGLFLMSIRIRGAVNMRGYCTYQSRILAPRFCVLPMPCLRMRGREKFNSETRVLPSVPRPVEVGLPSTALSWNPHVVSVLRYILGSMLPWFWRCLIATDLGPRFTHLRKSLIWLLMPQSDDSLLPHETSVYRGAVRWILGTESG